MGSTYSHMVFQPPTPPTYRANPGGDLVFSRVRDGEVLAHAPGIAPLVMHSAASVAGSRTIPLVVLDPPAASQARSGAAKEARKFTILYSHGNGEDLGLVANYAEQLALDTGARVVAYDYTGYGAAQTVGQGEECSEKQVYADALTAHDYCVTSLGVTADELVLMGRSLGSGPAVHLACQIQAAGLVLISPLASCVRVVFDTRVTCFFDMFANVDKVRRVACPVLVVHGREDEVVPFEHSDMLVRQLEKRSVKTEVLYLDGVGHNDMELQHQDLMHARYKDFLLSSACAPSSSDAAPAKRKCF